MSSIQINNVHDSFTFSSAQNTVLLCLQYNCFICNQNFRMIYYQMPSLVNTIIHGLLTAVPFKKTIKEPS